MARVAELEEAVDVANSAVQVALYELRQAAQFGGNQDPAFNEWMGEATSSAERLEAEKPTEVLVGEFREELDEIFAKAFPALYPDHPVNQKPLLTS